MNSFFVFEKFERLAERQKIDHSRNSSLNSIANSSRNKQDQKVIKEINNIKLLDIKQLHPLESNLNEAVNENSNDLKSESCLNQTIGNYEHEIIRKEDISAKDIINNNEDKVSHYCVTENNNNQSNKNNNNQNNNTSNHRITSSTNQNNDAEQKISSTQENTDKIQPLHQEPEKQGKQNLLLQPRISPKMQIDRKYQPQSIKSKTYSEKLEKISQDISEKEAEISRLKQESDGLNNLEIKKEDLSDLREVSDLANLKFLPGNKNIGGGWLNVENRKDEKPGNQKSKNSTNSFPCPTAAPEKFTTPPKTHHPNKFTPTKTPPTPTLIKPKPPSTKTLSLPSPTPIILARTLKLSVIKAIL